MQFRYLFLGQTKILIKGKRADYILEEYRTFLLPNWPTKGSFTPTFYSAN